MGQFDVTAKAENIPVADIVVDPFGLVDQDTELKDLAEEGQAHLAALGIKARTTYDVNRIVGGAIAHLRGTYKGRC